MTPAVVRARGRGRLFALVDLLDRLEREGRRLAAVLSFNTSRWTARVAADLLGGGTGGKRRVLAMDRTNWYFGKTAINIPMVSVIWNGVPLIWTPLPPEVVEGARNASPACARYCACYRAEPKPAA